MSLKKLHAGEGYTYLTRQVATGDNARRSGELMADYYTAHGLPAGMWWGKGAEQLGVSGEVTEAQMRAAYGEFLHPDADEKLKELIRGGVKPEDAIERVRLGAKPYDYNRDIPFMVRRKEALDQFALHNERTATEEEREAIEMKIANEMLPPELVGSQESARQLIADAKRMARYPVAGYDLVFTPMKSVSVLWGIADEDVRKAITSAHMQAVDESLEWLEDNAIYTRAGKDGVRKVDCAGMTVAKFLHWDNRAGDPNLHTHCAVLNRVFSEGKYRTIDGTVLYRAAVTASEHYNARLKDLVQERLGVSFEQVEKTRGARKVWEISGVPDKLMAAFSRRGEVVARAQELVEEYRATYHREPPKSVQWQIMEQANLETRGAKGEAKSLKELHEEWSQTADSAVDGVDRQGVLSAVEARGGDGVPPMYERRFDAQVVDAVVDTVSTHASTWTALSLESEVYRQLSHFRFDSNEDKKAVVRRLVTQATFGECILIDRHSLEASGPRRADGESVFYSHGARRFTNSLVLAAEDRLHAAADQWVVNTHTEQHYEDATKAARVRHGFDLSQDQQAFVRHLLFSPASLAVASGAAGTGKTAALDVFARAWEQSGNRVVALAPSAKAAEVLQENIGVEARTLASARVHGLSGPDGSELSEGDVVVVDEAGMASTRDLDAIVAQAREAGAVVRLVGDPQQLSAVETGGMLGELAEATDAPLLTDVRRFADADEAQASLLLRDGNKKGLDWYLDNDRVVGGLEEDLPRQAFAEWLRIRQSGKTSVMIAADKRTVADLNNMARSMFVADGQVDPSSGEVSIYAGDHAAVGDMIVTRQNDSRLRYGYGDKHRVKNGDLWTVREVGEDGSILAERVETGQCVQLPADYVSRNVELGYASTIHRAQGITVDESLLVATTRMDRQSLYVGMTRGKESNRVFVPNDVLPDPDEHITQLAPPDEREVLETIIARDGRSVTAHAALREAAANPELGGLLTIYRELHGQLVTPVWQSLCPDAETRQQLEDDPHSARLAGTIARCDAAGYDTAQVVGDAIVSAKQRFERERAEAEKAGTEFSASLAFYVRMAIEDNTETPRLSDLSSVGVAPVPAWREGVMDEDTFDATRRAADLIEREVARIGDDAIDQRPEWTSQVAEFDADNPEGVIAWKKAVRAIAAAKAAGVVGDDLDSLDGQLGELVSDARASARRGRTNDDDRLGSYEIDKALRECEDAAVAAEAERDKWLHEVEKRSATARHYTAVSDERDFAVSVAQLAKRIADCQGELEQARVAERQARLEVDQAHDSLPLGRKKRIDAATAAYDSAVAQRRVAQERVGAVREEAAALNLTEEQWDEQVALAGNDAEWEQRFAVARDRDGAVVGDAVSQAERAGEEASLWRSRAGELEALAAQHAPASPEVREFYHREIVENLQGAHPVSTKSASQDTKQKKTPAHDVIEDFFAGRATAEDLTAAMAKQKKKSPGGDEAQPGDRSEDVSELD